MNDLKKKILIIEDDSFLSRMYADKFESEGFEVFSSYDGIKGLHLAKDEMPDIILLDIILPKMSGFDVLKQLKEQEETKKIPVILLTNLGKKENIAKGFALGANDYLIKAHFTPSEVINKIKKIINI